MHFVKTEWKFRHFFLLKKYKHSNLEYNLNCGFVKTFYNTALQMNDCFSFKKPRGFKYLDVFVNVDDTHDVCNTFMPNIDTYVISDLKLNVYNYPIL